LVTVYGTGSVDHVAQTPDSRAVVSSVRETFNGVGIGPEVTWMRVMDENESLTGEPVVYGHVAYFTSYVSNTSNACDPGLGRLYGVHYTQTDGTSLASGDNTQAYLDADGEAATLDYVKYIVLDNTVPHGVQVVERPGCLGEGLDSNGLTGGSFTPGEIELVINVANAKSGDASASTIPPSASSGALTTKSVTQPIPSTGQNVLPGAWGYVLY
jgi:hypothetical protein